jgi:hypothetical protein
MLPARDFPAVFSSALVEARSRTGELFGFDRTSAIAADSAESIAQATQKFGQQDDITVLTLSRDHATEAPSTGRSAVPSESTA